MIELLLRCRGDQHTASPCHFDPETTVHEFRIEKEAQRSYVKAYWDDDLEQTVFTSVHPSGATNEDLEAGGRIPRHLPDL